MEKLTTRKSFTKVDSWSQVEQSFQRQPSSSTRMTLHRYFFLAALDNIKNHPIQFAPSPSALRTNRSTTKRSPNRYFPFTDLPTTPAVPFRTQPFQRPAPQRLSALCTLKSHITYSCNATSTRISPMCDIATLSSSCTHLISSHLILHDMSVRNMRCE
jgi:hypothetical protein